MSSRTGRVQQPRPDCTDSGIPASVHTESVPAFSNTHVVPLALNTAKRLSRPGLVNTALANPPSHRTWATPTSAGTSPPAAEVTAAAVHGGVAAAEVVVVEDAPARVVEAPAPAELVVVPFSLVVDVAVPTAEVAGPLPTVAVPDGAEVATSPTGSAASFVPGSFEHPTATSVNAATTEHRTTTGTTNRCCTSAHARRSAHG